jgi:hypothetical protein
MNVYVGNPTQQNRELHYRLKDQPTVRVVFIPAGGQELLPDDLSGVNLPYVISQLQRLGAMESNDLNIILPKALVYKVESKPIEADVLQEGLAQDEEARQNVSAQMMEQAGLAAFQNANAVKPGGVVETSVEVFESSDHGQVKGKDRVNMEIAVSSKPSRRAGKRREEAKA